LDHGPQALVQICNALREGSLGVPLCQNCPIQLVVARKHVLVEVVRERQQVLHLVQVPLRLPMLAGGTDRAAASRVSAAVDDGLEPCRDVVLIIKSDWRPPARTALRLWSSRGHIPMVFIGGRVGDTDWSELGSIASWLLTLPSSVRPRRQVNAGCRRERLPVPTRFTSRSSSSRDSSVACGGRTTNSKTPMIANEIPGRLVLGDRGGTVRHLHSHTPLRRVPDTDQLGRRSHKPAV
jgi:hypothetical protein